MGSVNYSKQRETIQNFLNTRTDHPTAETIYAEVRKEMPNISMGTVYRNLALLEKLGLIKKLSVNNEPDHYDGSVAPHQHFICSSCGCVDDIFLADTGFLERDAAKLYAGDISGHDIFFYGTCPGCRNK